jgi:hypothetical protein
MSVESARPMLKVIRGDATPEEVAAILAVFGASARRAAAAGTAAHQTPPAWLDRGFAMSAPPTPGPGAWRASAWPR